MSTSYLNRLGAIDFSRTIERLAEGFTGREWLFDKLDNWLQQEDEEKFYLLTGEPGVGKSAIAARLTQRWADDEPVESCLAAYHLEGCLAAYHFCRAGDVETVRPGRVLRSLATQLGKTLPHYGEALKEVLDQVHVRIDVNINIDRLSNSQVTGIYVENLKELDPREEFRLLIQAPLAELAKIYAKPGNTPPRLKVFLIDSLDEAATTTGQENMVTLLSSLYQARETLPPWVRFLLTARPDRSVLNQFLPLQSQRIEELEDNNLSDIQRYVQGRVDEQLREERSTPEPQTSNAIVTNPKSLQQRLAEAELTAEKLVGEVKELSHGNFLYTKLLLNSIASGEQSIKNLSALPKDLNEIYHRILRYRCSFRGWLKRYQPILGTLSVTQEPVSQTQLSKFIGIGADELAKDLDVFRQFLDESKDEQGQPLYTIFHQSLREYLLDRNHNHDFWCDAREQHHVIIDCFEKESEGWQNLRAIDLYGLRHLAQHLVRATQVDKLHQLLSREKDGRNAWFDAKDGVAETAGFLTDVELAWSQADEAYDNEPRRSIGLQCRYALIKTSINTLAGIPKELMVSLVKHKYWKHAQALDYIRQIPDPGARCESLMKLVQQLLDRELLKNQALQLALEASQAVENEQHRVELLTALVDKLTPNLLSKALDAALAVKDESYRTAALMALANRLPEALSQALEAALIIQNAYNRAQALAKLAYMLMPELLPKVLEAALAFQHEDCRAQLLMALATRLPDLLPKALESALAIPDEYYRALSLTALADKLSPELLPQALAAALAIQHKHGRTKVLTALVGKCPEAFPQALEAALVFDSEYERVEALTAIVDKCPDALPQALEAALAIRNEYDRAKALVTLAGSMPEVLPQALEAALAIQDVSYRAEILTALVGKCPEAFPQALQAAQAIQLENFRAEALRALADELPLELLPQALEAALTIQDEYHRVWVLIALVDKLPEVLPKALQAALTIKGDHDRAGILTALVDKCPEVLPQALQAAQAIRDEDLCTQVLVALTDKLTPELLSQALAITLAIPREYDRAEALRALAGKLTPELLPQALAVTLAIRMECDRAEVFEVLVVLADKLTPELLPQALEATLALEVEYDRIRALTALADKLPEALPQALAVVMVIENEHNRAQALVALADKLTPELLPQALAVALDIQDEESRVWVLVALADKLTPELLPQALAAALDIQQAYHRVRALTALADKLPEALPQALAITLAIQDEYHRAQALKILADKLTPELLPQALAAVLDIQQEYHRAQVLAALANKLTPELLPQMLKATLALHHEICRAEALTALADKLPEVLPQALEAVLAIQTQRDRAWALRAVVNKLTPELLPQALEATLALEDKDEFHQTLKALAHSLINTSNRFNLWKDLLHFLSCRTRPALLRDIAALAPVIFTLGDQAGAAETAQAIQQVAKWWP